MHPSSWLGSIPVLLAAACGPGATTPPDLEGRSYLSTSVTEGGSARPLVEGTRLSLSFRPSQRVGASAGCNSLEGSYEIRENTFVLGEAGMTEMGCDPERHAQDEWYFGLLGSKPAITIDGNTVVLDGSGVRIEYLDREVATPDLELVGPTWTVDTIIDGEAASHAQWPSPATIVFAEDGTVSVSTGCNSGTGATR